MVELRGIEPLTSASPPKAESPQIRAKSTQDNTLVDSPSSPRKQKPNKSTHKQDRSLHSKRVPEEYQNLPEDLAKVVDAWDGLPDTVKVGILDLVREAGRK